MGQPRHYELARAATTRDTQAATEGALWLALCIAPARGREWVS